VLATYLSIEATPVRECLAASPADYRWSSHGHHANGSDDAIVLDHPLYLNLGATWRERQHAYQALFCQRVSDRAPVEIRPSAHFNSTLSGDRLANQMDRLVRRVRPGTKEHAFAAA
jgi:putative transposase